MCIRVLSVRSPTDQSLRREVDGRPAERGATDLGWQARQRAAQGEPQGHLFHASDLALSPRKRLWNIIVWPASLALLALPRSLGATEARDLGAPYAKRRIAELDPVNEILRMLSRFIGRAGRPADSSGVSDVPLQYL